MVCLQREVRVVVGVVAILAELPSIRIMRELRTGLLLSELVRIVDVL